LIETEFAKSIRAGYPNTKNPLIDFSAASRNSHARAGPRSALKMRLIIHDTPEALAHYIARYIQQRIIAFKPTPERPFVLGLPTGSSPVTV
jgi:hypothetical protein